MTNRLGSIPKPLQNQIPNIMSEIVYQSESNGQIVTTSLQVAEFFGKQHKRVLANIDKILKNQTDFGLVNFERSKYLDKKGEWRPMYIMNQKGFALLGMSFTGEEAMKFKVAYIEAFSKMEDHIKDEQMKMLEAKNPASQMLLLAANLQKTIEDQEIVIHDQSEAIKDKDEQIHVMTNKIAEMNEKVSYVNRILSSTETLVITQIAKDYGKSAIEMNKLLNQLKIQYKVNDQWVLYREYQEYGYTCSKEIEITRRNGRKDYKLQTEWTKKGRLFLYEKLKKYGILPLMEQ